MGASGQAGICFKGHCFQWISEGLFWDVGITKTCPCGAETLAVVCHYGGINDCVRPEEPRWLKIGTEVLLFPVKGAVDADGSPIEAFVPMEVDIYDVSHFVEKQTHPVC